MARKSAERERESGERECGERERLVEEEGKRRRGYCCLLKKTHKTTCRSCYQRRQFQTYRTTCGSQPGARAQTITFTRERQLQTERTTRRFLLIHTTGRLIHTNDASFDHTHERQCIQAPDDTPFDSYAERQCTRHADGTSFCLLCRTTCSSALFLIFFIFHFKSILHLIKYIQIIFKLH